MREAGSRLDVMATGACSCDCFKDARRRVGDVVGIAPIVRVEVGGGVRYGWPVRFGLLRWGGGLSCAWVVLGWCLGGG